MNFNLVMLFLKVILQLDDCSDFNSTTSSSGRTGYGVPDPVTSVYVINTYNQCNIVWTHIHNEVTYYQVLNSYLVL